MPVDVAQLTAADFEPRIDDDFLVPAPNGEVVFKLVQVSRLGDAPRRGGAFSLIFQTPPGPFLPQAIYPLKNAALGTLDLFIVPLGPKDGGNCYEAVFT